MRATFYANKEWELARFQFLLDKRDPFKKGPIVLEALSETRNSNADGVVMNPAC